MEAKMVKSPQGVKFYVHGHSVREEWFNALVTMIKATRHTYHTEVGNMAGEIGCVKTQSWTTLGTPVPQVSRKQI